ncbi:glycosyltransferase WbuB [Chryseobacterium sp. G0162]|uniref:glycosyltransferase family 4 protein n=1 Tax=Chryseobacterium sp. G0162 TaxID=2487063 RepID=UPI000F4E425D|nr:glycosyltransferase family 4 protein [Chryseobacterium sp. G0162]AZB07640.1 glycosyltransferase WbuB [Chryseobacterium sp. G0162]
MKILLLHQYFLEEEDPGGSRWNEITKTWTEEGHEVTVIAGMVHYNGFTKREEYKKKYFVKKKQGAITVHRTHVSESYNSGFIGRLWGYFSFMFSSLWAGLFKVKGKFDVVVVTSPPLFVGGAGYLISRFKRIPMIFEVRDLWPESAIDMGILSNKLIIKMAYWFESFMYKKATLISVLTPAFYNSLIKLKKVKKEKLAVVPNASNFALSDGLLHDFDREQFRRDNDLDEYFVIIYVGAHGVANHLKQVLDAGKILEDTNVLFLLIGEGMEKAKLKQKALQMNVFNVRFLDSVSKKEVLKYIIASDMGASILKKIDTFKTVYSNKTFDYFSCKKPVLMAIDGVSRVLIEEARAGEYVEPENADEYSRVIRSYMADPERLLREGENGYQYAKINFDREIIAKKYLNIIRESIQ